jgi:hypothetical protein
MGKQVLNMMACGPLLYFLKHFSMELRHETAENLLLKLLSCKLRLLGQIRDPVEGHTLAGILADDDEDGPTAAKDGFFKNPPVFTFCSDNPNVMMKLRRLALENREFTFAMGCSPHALNKFCEDIIKTFAGPKRIVKQIVAVVIGVRQVHLFHAVYDKLCLEKFGKTLALVLYTKTRWGTVKHAAQRILRARPALMQLASEVEMNPDLHLKFPVALKTTLQDNAFWKGVKSLDALFTPIVSCLTFLEGDEATFSSVYACYLAILYHIRTLQDTTKDGFGPDARLNHSAIELMEKRLLSRFNTQYSPAHALAFRTDPFYDRMRERLTEILGDDAVCLGQGSIVQQCKVALKRIAGSDTGLLVRLRSQFAKYLNRDTSNDDDFIDINTRPHTLWGLADPCQHGDLIAPLVALHQNPTGAAAGERNHKAAKRVHNRMRARLGREKVERGTAIMFNGEQLDRRLSDTRDTPFTLWLSRLGQNGDNLAEEELDEEEIETAVAQMAEFNSVDPDQAVSDGHLFSDDGADDEIVVGEGLWSWSRTNCTRGWQEVIATP